MGIGKKIGEECKDSGLTLRQLAIKADIPYSTLYSAVKRDSDGIDAGTITRIANALEIPISKFYNDPAEGEGIISRERGALEELALSVKYSLKKIDDSEKADQLKKLLEERIPIFAKKFLIPEDILKVDAYDYVQQFLNDDPESFDILELTELQRKILDILDTMNPAGQQTAVDRVEELAQIPKYKKAAGDSTQSVPEDEPAE